jgi:hypothetical protein
MTIFNIEEISMQVFDDATGKISLVIVKHFKKLYLFLKKWLRIYLK